MRSTREEMIAQAKATAKSAVPKRYILTSPELNILRRIRNEELAAKKLLEAEQRCKKEQALLAKESFEIIQQSFKTQENKISTLNISQPETVFSGLQASITPTQLNQGMKSTIDQQEPKFIPQPPYFLAFGCHGEKNPTPKKVAEKFINDIKAAGKRPAFVLLLGDNFYDNGVDSPDAKAFKEVFEYLYGELAALEIPCIAILGNHDENLHRANVISTQARGIEQGLNQVAQSYVSKRNYSHDDLKKLYGMTPGAPEVIELPLNKLPLWNMPNRYYSLDFVNTEIFCIDSNTYAKDYFEYLACLETGKSVDPNNQAVWLARESKRAKAEGKHVLFAQHHPLITPGKRFENADSPVYFNIPQDPLSPEALKIADRFFPGIANGAAFSFSKILKRVYKEQDLNPDAILHAHDHNMYYINRPASEKDPMSIRQFCFGGGGGSIQPRQYFGGIQNHLACHIDHHGVGKVVCDDKLLISMHTTDDQYHLEFALKDKYPRRHYNKEIIKESAAVEDFCIVVKRAINTYFKNGGGGVKGVTRAHDVWAYISNMKADSLAKTVLTVKERMLKDYFAAPEPGSLITYLNEELSAAYKNQYPHGVTIEKFAEQFEVRQRLVKSV